MKLKMAIIAIVMFCASASDAQVLKYYGVKVGAVSAIQTFGLQYSDFEVSPTEYRWGLDVGAFAELFDSPHLSLLTELHYIQKGYSDTPISLYAGGGNVRVQSIVPIGSFRYDFLSVPLLGKVRFGSDVLSFYVLVGPRLDFLLGTGDHSAIPYSSPQSGVTLGIGIQLPIGSGPQILIEGRFSPTLGYVYKDRITTVTSKSFEILMGASL